MDIGFIGLGNMGAPMALNLINAGYKLHVYDVVSSNVEALTKAGAVACESSSGAFKNDIVISMLPAGHHVDAVYNDNDLNQADSKTLFIDCSTIDVATARNVHQRLAEKNLAMIEAPVSGGVAGAKAGKLTMMVAGEQAYFELAKPILDILGSNIIYCGSVGNGQAAKICNNMMLGIQMISVAEAFVLAEKLNLDAKVLFDVASKASGQCWSLTSYCPVPGIVETAPSNNEFKPGFAAQMMLKDMLLSQQAANQVGLNTDIAQMATQKFQEFCDDGHALKDFSAIINQLRGQQDNDN